MTFEKWHKPVTGVIIGIFVVIALFQVKLIKDQSPDAKPEVRSVRSFENEEAETKLEVDPMEYSFEDFSMYRSKPKITTGVFERVRNVVKTEDCRMSNCFDFEICRKNGYKIYVYPQQLVPSDIYQNIISSIKGSTYYTENPDEACIKILSLDTIDRDVLSTERFVKDLPRKLKTLPGWNNGQNHLVFNLYSGTWPDYNEDLFFDLGKAILAKASISFEKYRSGFDISLPLWTLSHPVNGTHRADFNLAKWPPSSKYLVSFKGKRYLSGVGSKTRNQLFYFNDDPDHDVIMLTTCKHGSNWETGCDSQDEHQQAECLRTCNRDNAEYDRWDYRELLHNSTFCLVPRGRRLGSFRFIEVMEQGCIPILMANGWVVPFTEKIDWSRAALIWDERLLIEFKDYIAEIDQETVSRMRQQAAWLYSTYFSSIDKIIQTTIEIIHDRVFPSHARTMQDWNTEPGALIIKPSSSPKQLPVLKPPVPHTRTESTAKFTAVVYVTELNDKLGKLVEELFKAERCNQVVLLWACELDMPDPEGIVDSVPEGKLLNLIDDGTSLLTNKFKDRPKYFMNDCLFFIDDNVQLIVEEINFGFKAWTNFHESIVGFRAMEYVSLEMDITNNRGMRESKTVYGMVKQRASTYSMIDFSAAWIHRYYLTKFNQSPKPILDLVNESNDCEEVVMNMIVAEHIGQGPILLTPKSKELYIPSDGKKGSLFRDKSTVRDELDLCLNEAIKLMGGNFLKTQSFRLEPMLYKDRMNINHKRYQKMDQMKTRK